jgi:hypothetical protein
MVEVIRDLVDRLFHPPLNPSLVRLKGGKERVGHLFRTPVRAASRRAAERLLDRHTALPDAHPISGRGDG